MLLRKHVFHLSSYYILGCIFLGFIIGFTLQHLYHKASIHAEILQGYNACLYNMIVQSVAFNVTLCLVVLVESGGNSEPGEHFAYLFGDNDQDRKELRN